MRSHILFLHHEKGITNVVACQRPPSFYGNHEHPSQPSSSTSHHLHVVAVATSRPLACVASHNCAGQYRPQPTNRYQPIVDCLWRKPIAPLSTCTKRRNRTLPGSNSYALLPPSYPEYLTKHRNHHDPVETDHRPARPSSVAMATVSRRRPAAATATKMHCQHTVQLDAAPVLRTAVNLTNAGHHGMLRDGTRQPLVELCHHFLQAGPRHPSPSRACAALLQLPPSRHASRRCADQRGRRAHRSRCRNADARAALRRAPKRSSPPPRHS
jgi:hypothetical protein